MTKSWENFAVAIEKEGKDVDDLVSHEDMPRMDGATVVSQKSLKGPK